MRIAYYEENDYHTEIIGTFIENFKDEITIFNTSDKSDYINWFKKNLTFTLEPIDNFIKLYKNFDKIIIGTSINFKFIDDISISKDKLIFIHHLKDEIYNYNEYINIVLTPLNKLNFNHYILPINNIYKNISKKYNKITIGLIGRFKNTNRDINDLIKLITNYTHLNFNFKIFARHIKFIPDSLIKLREIYPDKLNIHLKLKTEQIIKMIEDINYFCPLTDSKSQYLEDRLTGIIPFSYNFNTPLLIDEKTNIIYELKSSIIYKNSLCDIIEEICNKNIIEYEELLNNVINEKEMILTNNKKILDNIYDL